MKSFITTMRPAPSVLDYLSKLAGWAWKGLFRSIGIGAIRPAGVRAGSKSRTRTPLQCSVPKKVIGKGAQPANSIFEEKNNAIFDFCSCDRNGGNWGHRL